MEHTQNVLDKSSTSVGRSIKLQTFIYKICKLEFSVMMQKLS